MMLTKYYRWFLKVTIHLYNNVNLTVSGVCDNSGNSYGLTLVYVYEDGAECLPISPQEFWY